MQPTPSRSPKIDRNTIVYTAQKSGLPKGIRFANPRHFSGVRAGVTRAVICGNWPKVAEAYRKADIAVVLCDDAGRVLKPEDAADAPATAPIVDGTAAAAPKTAMRFDAANLKPANVVVPTAAAAPVPATAYLPTAEPLEQRGKVFIPQGWTDLQWPAMRKLASQVCDTPIVSKEDATAAIEAELARRAALPPKTDDAA